MRLFNRTLLIVVLLAIMVFAGFSAAYAFMGQDDYLAAHLPAFLAVQEPAGPVQGWLGNFEGRLIPVWQFAILVVVGLAGLALLVFELFPRRSRYLKVRPGVRVERHLVEEEAERVAADDPAVLSSSARLVPRRGRSSKLLVRLKVRKGENLREAEARVREAMADRVADQGQLRIARAKVKGSTRDPRGSKRRVR